MRKFALLCIVLTIFAATATPVGAVSGSVVINEIMYNPVSDLDEHEYLELHNPGDTPVPLNGMSFTEGFTGTFGDVTLGAGEYIIVSPSSAASQSFYGVPAALEYVGGIKNSGETVTLTAADGLTVVDSVTYTDLPPWPLSPDGNGPSLELINPAFDNNDPASWAASINPTPGAQNSKFGEAPAVQFGPVTVDPAWPDANVATTISLEIGDTDSATLFYRVMFGSESSISMSKSGSTFSAQIPGQAAGDLVRYRIETNTGAVFPTEDDSISDLGYVVKKSVTTNLPTIEWFITDEDFQGLYSEESRLGPVDLYFPATIAYDGTVYTGVQMKVRGGEYSRANNAKQGFSVEFPSGHDFVAPELFPYPVDEFALKYDFTVARGIVSWDVVEQAGFSDYTTFYVRVQKNGVFHAQYRVKEKLDGKWRKQNNYDSGQFFKADGGFKYHDNNGGFEKKNPDDGDFTDIDDLVVLVKSNPSAAELWQTFDVPNIVNYWAVSSVIRHQDQDHHNKYVYFDEFGTGQWSLVPWDLDHTWGSNGNEPCRGQSMVTLSCFENPLYDAFWVVPEFREMYFRRIRSLVDGPLTPPRIEDLNAVIRAGLAADAEEERAVWGQNPLWGDDLNFLGNVQSRRDIFEADSRVPDSQPATPAIVINELHYNPLDGRPEFLELVNTTDEWIDLSLWQLDGVGLTIPGGTVVEPNGFVVFTDDVPLFRSLHSPGADYLVIQYPGGLKGGGELVQLLLPNGTVIDSVEYTDQSPWEPLPDLGVYSLELADPGLDNSLPTSWHASIPENGTPGQVNSAGQEPSNSTLVTYTSPVLDQGTPQQLSGSVGSDIARLDVIAVDLGAAGATGIPNTQLTWWDGSGWGAATRTTLEATIDNGTWSFNWNPVPGGSGSYAVGIIGYDAGGAQVFPIGKDLQAILVISDTSRPVVSTGEPVVTDTVLFSGAASDDVAVRKVRLLIRHVESNEYWNGTSWITSAQAATDSSVLLTADVSAPLSGSPTWSYELASDRTGSFSTLHWAQNGAFQYSIAESDLVVR